MRKTLAIALLLLPLAPADAAETVVALPHSITVEAPTVRLGELFLDAPAETADRPALAAPAPGETVHLGRDRIARIAAANDLHWLAEPGFGHLRINRAADYVSPEMIEAMLEEALAHAGDDGRSSVSLSGPRRPWALPAGEQPTLSVEALTHDPASGTLSANIIAATSLGEHRLAVQAKAQSIIEIPVLVTRKLRDSVIRERDLGWAEIPLDRLGRDTITDIETLVGMAARRTLRADQPIDNHDIMPPRIVERNEVVTIFVRTDTMTLSARGKALEDGAMGDVIRIRNTTSNRTIEAEITGPGAAQVAASANHVY